MSSARDPTRRSTRPPSGSTTTATTTTTNGSSSKAPPPSSSSPSTARRSPPRDGYYAGGEFDDDSELGPPLSPLSPEGPGFPTSFPGDGIYPSASGGAVVGGRGGGRGGEAPQLRGGGGPAPPAPLSLQQQQQQQQQQHRIPPSSRGSRALEEPPKPRPQSYAGSMARGENDYSPPRNSSSNKPSSGGHYRRSSNAPPSGGGGGTTSRRKPTQDVPDLGPAQAAAPSAVSRLESPSIIRSVLQPLEKKMNEYANIMTDAQATIAQLDEELRLLQEKRRREEDKHEEAKQKHDEYERQHHDVGRALRGEVDEFAAAAASGGANGARGLGNGPVNGNRPLSPQTYQQIHRPLSPPGGYHERPMSGGANSSRTTQKLRARDRFRMSLFGR